MTSTTLRLTLTQEADYAFRVHFDETTVADLLTDESPPLGKGEGPNPTRMLLAAVANCLSASLLFALRKFKNQPGTLVTTATAELVKNERGRTRVGHIHVSLALAEEGSSHAHLERLMQQFEDFCVVTESVRAGVPVTVEVTDKAGNTLHTSAAPAMTAAPA